MEYIDYYQVLSVNKDASTEEIRAAYRKLARKYHPDVNPGDEEAVRRFAEISEAQAVLTDPERRAKYGRLESSWEAHQRDDSENEFNWNEWISDVNAENGDVTLDTVLKKVKSGDREKTFSDFYEVVFAGVGGADGLDIDPQTGQDQHEKLEISLEEAFTGTSRVLRVGGGRRIQVKIPRGASAGTQVRVRGEGKEGLDGSKGDLYLEIVLTPHPLFERKGDDLQADLPVDLYTAVLGGEAVVPTFKGKIKLRIPPETQSGRTFRLKGQGMPRLKQPDQRGDLYARVMVQLPQNLSDEEIALFEELADIRGL